MANPRIGLGLVPCLLLLGLSSTAWAQEWETQRQLPDNRSQAIAAQLPGGTLLVGGGYLGAAVTNTTQIFDPGTESWSTGPAMPVATRGAAACVVDGIVYVIGGYDRGHMSTVQAYDHDGRSWRSLANLPTARWELSCAVSLVGRIHALGGEGGLREHNVYDPDTNQWSPGPPIPDDRQQHDSFAGIDGRIYLVGGGTSQQELTSTCRHRCGGL